ncbi:MAG: hypothetical protein JO273_22300 [Methylobacteriaceae bacterium]|nr:hypothetical protein [Methylobacteriaceae bacterium]
MQTSLSISDVKRLIAERARQIDPALSPDRIDVYEDPHSTDGGALIVQILSKRLDDRSDWTRLRLRLSHAIRDALVEHGDDRYPLIEVFAAEEWATRSG